MGSCERTYERPNQERQKSMQRRCSLPQWRVSQCFRDRSTVDWEQSLLPPNVRSPDRLAGWKGVPFRQAAPYQTAFVGYAKRSDCDPTEPKYDRQNLVREREYFPLGSFLKHVLEVSGRQHP